MKRRRFDWQRLGRASWTAGIVAALLALGVGGAPGAGFIGARAAHVAAGRAGEPPQAQPIVAVAKAVSLDSAGDTARLSFELTGLSDSPLKAFALADPDRIIVDVPGVAFDIDPAAGKPDSGRRHHRRQIKAAAAKQAGLVASFRFGLLAPGRSRIVIDLGAPARIVSAAIRAEHGKALLVVALAKTDRASFREAARAQPVAPANPAPTLVATNLGKPVIVIDPGHGGPDTGAIVNGIIEKDIALAFGKRLARKLEADGGFNVVITRDSDVFIPLSERVAIARNANAALMISVHADTLAEAADVSGATVYTVSDKASDAYAAKVAAKENEADASVGVDGQADVADVNDILFDLTRQETRAYSHVFARTLVNYWKVAGRLNKNPQRAAGFVVLKAPDVPSVLLELGYLSSPTDVADLTSDVWRDKATGRMAEAIFAYFADRRGPAKAAAGVPLPLKQAAAETSARN